VQVTANNVLVLGGTGTYAVNTGLGYTAPIYKLHVNGNAVLNGSVNATNGYSVGAVSGITYTVATVTNAVGPHGLNLIFTGGILTSTAA